MPRAARSDDPPAGRRNPLLWRRWYELAPEVVLVTGLTLFFVDEPDAALSSFESTRAITIMACFGALWLAARLITWRFLPWLLARIAIFAVAAFAALAVVVLPAYDDTTVIEAFPGVSVPAPTSAATTMPASATPTPVSPTTVPASAAPTPVAPTTVPASAASTAPATTTVPATSPTSPPTTAAPTTAPKAAEPVLLRRGPFEGIDHRAMGTVSIYRNVDGSNVVGLEDFEIQPGPDYDVYVVPGSDREDTGNGVRLDDLRGNIGTQFYVVPADVDLGSGEWTVLVWCQTFGVPVANSTPTEV